MFVTTGLTDGSQYIQKTMKLGVTFLVNPKGYVKAKNENEIYRFLESYFKQKNWEYIGPDKYELPNGQRIDFVVKGYPDMFIEVKNDWARKKYLKQVIGYKKILSTYKDQFNLIFLCMGIDEDRKKLLTKHNIQVILLKDLIL